MLKGNGVSQGLGVAKAMVWHPPINQDYIPRKSSTPEEENTRFDEALQTTLQKMEETRQKAALQLGKSEAAIFAAYYTMLTDEEALITPIHNSIRARSLTAEYACFLQFTFLASQFLQLEDEYMAQRAEDILALRDQLLRQLQGTPVAKATHLTHPTIVVAHALFPTDIANLDLSRLEGIVCATGGYTSHMAIVARTMGIPAVVGLPNIFKQVQNGQLLALDGNTGEVWLSPRKKELDVLHHRAGSLAEKQRNAQLFRGCPTISTDGHRVELSATISSPSELDAAIACDAESLGMLRTEFLFKNTPATEEEQFSVYCSLLHKMKGKAATIRTFDVAGQQPTKPSASPPENNPALGRRGIRASLSRPSLFRAQLRALLRASAYGNLKILFPMVCALDEIDEALSALENVKQELHREGTPYDENLPIGVIIGIPSAALMVDAIAPKVQFLSIDSNDLIQFTLAIDSSNSHLAYLFKLQNPAIIRLVARTVQGAHKHHIPCNIFGDAPQHELTLPLMFGLGVDGFSINPNLILSSRSILNTLDFAACSQLATNILLLHTTAEVTKQLVAFSQKSHQPLIP